MNTSKNTYQAVFNFACDSCPWKVTGRCDGPTDGETYLMQSDRLVPCIDVEKRGLFYADIHDRVIPTALSSRQQKINLPPFVASIKDGMILPKECSGYTFAIPLGRILNKSGTLKFQAIEEIKRRFGIPRNSRVALIGTGKDDKIEAMWKISDRKQIWEQISKVGFDWITTPCFSVWTETPRAHQIWSQDRILQTHDILAGLGVPCIPFFFPIEEADFNEIAKWLKARPDVNKIAVYGRYYSSKKDFPYLLDLMRRIQSLADNSLEFLVVGIATADKIFAIGQEFKATIVTGKPFHRAYAGEICKSDLTYESSSLLKNDLILHNLKQNYDYCEKQQARHMELALA